MDPYKRYKKELDRGDTVMVHTSRKDAKGDPSYIVRTIPLQIELAKSQGFEVLADPPVETVETVETVEPKKAKSAKKATAKATPEKAEPTPVEEKAATKPAPKAPAKKTTK